MTHLNLFISYASEDRAIALSISNLLHRTFGDSLSEVFLDIEGIKVGGDIKESIQEALGRADVLILVCTGVQRSTYDWPGFELGFFQATQKMKQSAGTHSNSAVGGKVITICLDGNQPNTTSTTRYVPLGIDAGLLGVSQTEFDENLKITEADEFVKFLGDLLEATSGEKLSARKDLTDTYIEKVTVLKKGVFLELKGRVWQVRKPQRQLLVRYDRTALDRARQDLPANAEITSIGQAMGVFGVSEQDNVLFKRKLQTSAGVPGVSISWAEFQKLVSGQLLGAFWCASVARAVISAGDLAVDVDNSQVIASSDQTRRFRIILTTSSTFYNNEVEASLYLVEALQQKDYGKVDTSLLLKGLHIVCRYRFLFLEPESEFYYVNINSLNIDFLPKTARQLITELDFLYSEAMQANLDKPGTWIRFVPVGELEEMLKVWQPLEKNVRQLCADAIREEANSAALASTKADLGAQLKQIVDTVTKHNQVLLKAMAAKLSELGGS